MRRFLIRHKPILYVAAFWALPGFSALAEVKTTANKSYTVQPAGPRSGEAGSRYFNIEGKKNERYASFGVVVFELPKGDGQQGDVENLSIRLVQSIPKFAKDGKLRFLLAEPQDRGTDSLAELKFDPGSSNGVRKDAFKAIHRLGSGTFTTVKTGQVDSFKLTPDEAGRGYLKDRLKAGGPILIVVVPDDEDVAATYFGAGSQPETNRPQLVISP
jgi:hypothetical protein